MVFIIPIILGAAALASASVGTAAGASGIYKKKKAKKIVKNARRIHEQRCQALENAWHATNNLAEEYGRLQIECKLYTIGRFATFIAQRGQRTSQGEIKLPEGLEGVSYQQFQEYKSTALDAIDLVSGTFKAVGTGYAAAQGIVTLAGLFGTASTGTAISGLSGAAASSATLAWLGGGSLAASGGGMAVGALVLGGISLGPALAVGGLALRKKGKEKLQDARDYAIEVIIEVERINATRQLLAQADRRINELKYLVHRLNLRAIKGLEELESRPFVSERDAEKFQQVAILVRALSEILKIPVFTPEGFLNEEATRWQAKYQNF